MRTLHLCLTFMALSLTGTLTAQMDYQPPPDLEPMHRIYDELLDTYVRDGTVFYHALKLDRAKLDRYVASLAAALPSTVAGWDQPRQIAFWINAYNAISLQIAVSHYPVSSMRQIPGAFDQIKHVVAGKNLSLDQIETTILAGNYGEAGAIDRYGPGDGLPPVFSGANNFWYWGPPPARDRSAIAINVDPALLRRLFTTVRQVAVFHNGLGVSDDEQGAVIYRATGLRTSWARAWPLLRDFS